MLCIKKYLQKYNKRRKKVELQLSGKPMRSFMPGCLFLIIFPALAAVTGIIIYQILI
jgi:hypothetical protein